MRKSLMNIFWITAGEKYQVIRFVQNAIRILKKRRHPAYDYRSSLNFRYVFNGKNLIIFNERSNRTKSSQSRCI